MSFGLQILLGCALMVVTTFLHSGGMVLGLSAFRSLLERSGRNHPTLWKPVPIAVLVIVMFLASVIECCVWAVTYLAVGALEGIREALYFSTVTFSTLGYGDITLGEQWRLFASFEAANGLIMFGWTTALIAAAVARVYFPTAPSSSPST